jgi:hypothetical protein
MTPETEEQYMIRKLLEQLVTEVITVKDLYLSGSLEFTLVDIQNLYKMTNECIKISGKA